MQKLFLITLFLLTSFLNASPLEQVSIQLKWKHCFQFAGYYAAIEKGFYKEEGIDVTLKEVDLNRNFIEDVVVGKSEYGVSDSTLVVSHSHNLPVVLISQIFQHSPLVLISHRNSNITTPYDMIGKKISYSINGTGGTPFRALILKTIGNFEDVNISDFTSYQDFIDNKIDITSAYSTSQPYWLKKQGVEVNIIDPKSYGIDFYGDNFFTTQRELKEHPIRVEKMRKATLKGWEYALSHQDEIINLILEKYAPQKQKDTLAFEARGIYQMIMPDLIDLGSFSKKRYEQVTKTYHQLGIVDNEKIKDSFFYTNNQNNISLSDEERTWLKNNPMIKIAVMNYWETDKEGNNIHTDLIKLLNKYGNLNIVPVKFDAWKNGFKEVNSGKNIHAIANLSWSKERTKNFLYTKAYNFIPIYLIVKDKNSKIQSIKDLENKTLYLKSSSITNTFAREQLKNIHITNLPTGEEIYKKLSSSNGNIASLSYSVDEKKLEKYHLKIVDKIYGKYSEVAIGVNKKYPLLQSILNKIYKKIPQKELTALQNRIYKKFEDNIINFSIAEKEWLKKKPSVTFAGDPNWLPFEAFDENGKYIGIVADYLKNIEKLIPITFNPKQTKDWSQTIEHAKKGDVDVISDDINSKPLQKHYKPIPAYIKSPIVIVMKSEHGFVNDLKDIRDKKISLITDYGYNDNIKVAYPNQKFIYKKNADIALESLSKGEVDAVLLTMPKASYLLSTQGYTNLKIVGKTSVNLSLTLFIHKNLPELYTLIEKSIKELSRTKNLEILSKWQKVEFAKKTDYTLLFQVAGLLGLFLLGAFYWNRKLSLEIEKRKETELALAIAKEEADKANLAKSEFLANMSHEIRTPMNSILGFSELLAKQLSDPIQKDYLSSIIRGGNTLLSIINDILDLSKIEAGKLEIVLESVDVKQLALEMEAIFSVKLIQKNIHFELDIDPNLPKYILLDNTRIRQILFNLIGNAIKFTDHGSVKLGLIRSFEDVEKSKIDLCIYVEDSGIGISKDNLGGIFDAFEQQSGQDSQKYGGTGLGLAISKKLVVMMGGIIRVESQIDIGSKFIIDLPNISISSIETDIIKKRKEFNNIEFQKATILVVDDIKDNRILVMSTLNEYGFEVVEAKNGEDAISILENIKIDLIFMDIKMPIMDGYTASNIIKNNKNLKDVPLIALTASVMGRDLEKIKKYKFDGYLRKPVSQADLISQLEKFLKHDYLDLEDNTTQHVDISSYENLPKVIRELENKYITIWEEIKEMGDFTLISTFAESLEELGSQNGIDLLSRYAKDLKENCESFDIDKIDFMMNSFLSLIEKFKNITLESKNE